MKTITELSQSELVSLLRSCFEDNDLQVQFITSGTQLLKVKLISNKVKPLIPKNNWRTHSSLAQQIESVEHSNSHY